MYDNSGGFTGTEALRLSNLISKHAVNGIVLSNSTSSVGFLKSWGISIAVLISIVPLLIQPKGPGSPLFKKSIGKPFILR